MYSEAGIASIIRTTFLAKKKALAFAKRLDYKGDSRHDNPANWARAATACIAAKADPVDWVEAAFIGYKSDLGPFANQLGGPSAERWYAELLCGRSRSDSSGETVSMLQEELAQNIRYIHEMFQMKTGNPEAWLNYKDMADPFVAIEPHIRVAMAGRDGMWTVVEKFAGAAQQYLHVRPSEVNALENLGYRIHDYLNHPKSRQQPVSQPT